MKYEGVRESFAVIVDAEIPTAFFEKSSFSRGLSICRPS
jgi:hypothetical protein